MTRRGFLGLIAAAGASSALPTLTWLESPSAQAAAESMAGPAIMLRYLRILGGAAALSQVQVFADDECLLSAAVQAGHYLDWYGVLKVDSARSLRVEIDGDASFRAVASDNRTFFFDGVRVIEERR